MMLFSGPFEHPLFFWMDDSNLLFRGQTDLPFVWQYELVLIFLSTFWYHVIFKVLAIILLDVLDISL
jgi:hypothetical protein